MTVAAVRSECPMYGLLLCLLMLSPPAATGQETYLGCIAVRGDIVNPSVEFADQDGRVWCGEGFLSDIDAENQKLRYNYVAESAGMIIEGTFAIDLIGFDPYAAWWMAVDITIDWGPQSYGYVDDPDDLSPPGEKDPPMNVQLPRVVRPDGLSRPGRMIDQYLKAEETIA
jgi:hypothetical protein